MVNIEDSLYYIYYLDYVYNALIDSLSIITFSNLLYNSKVEHGKFIIPSLVELEYTLREIDWYYGVLDFTIIDYMVEQDLFKKYKDDKKMRIFKDSNFYFLEAVIHKFAYVDVINRVKKRIKDKINRYENVVEKTELSDKFYDNLDTKTFTFMTNHFMLQMIHLIIEERTIVKGKINLINDFECIMIENNEALGNIFLNKNILNNDHLRELFSKTLNLDIIKNEETIEIHSKSKNNTLYKISY